MPTVTSIIDTLTTPPFASLQQVLDTGGPYSGDNVLTTFTTTGAFLLPAGTYPVNGTYGMIVAFHTVPPGAGRVIGFNGIVSGQDISADIWIDQVAQVNSIRALPITGAQLITESVIVHQGNQLILWSPYLGTGQTIGLHVFPNWKVDLYYLCVL